MMISMKMASIVALSRLGSALARAGLRARVPSLGKAMFSQPETDCTWRPQGFARRRTTILPCARADAAGSPGGRDHIDPEQCAENCKGYRGVIHARRFLQVAAAMRTAEPLATTLTSCFMVGTRT